MDQNLKNEFEAAMQQMLHVVQKSVAEQSLRSLFENLSIENNQLRADNERLAKENG